MVAFSHQMADDGSIKMITVYADEEGFIVMTVFTPEEWEMILGIVELTGESLEGIIREIAQENNVTTITLDPKDFPA